MDKDLSIIPALRRKALVYELEEKQKEELLANELLYITNDILQTCKYIIYYGTIEYTELINGEEKKKYYHLDGITYIGQINSKKQRHGMGITYFSSLHAKNNNCDYERYTGEYSNDNKNGIGELEYRDHTLYIGEWKKNKKDGYGIIFRQNKYSYDGCLKNDEIHGYGILDIYKEAKYECNWYNSKPHGFCKKTKPNGEIEYSRWKNGIKNYHFSIMSHINDEILNPMYMS